MKRDITVWLQHLGLERYAERFRNAEVDLDVVPKLTAADLEELGLPLGPRRMVLSAAAELWSATDPPPPGVPEIGGPERRQLTLMFCDIVNSTILADSLDPEVLREVMRSYRELVAREVARFDGSVARFIGDGALAYFGWPRAHEDDAERAVRSALMIVAASWRLKAPAGSPLRVRIGIATGLVVVGDLVNEDPVGKNVAVGSTPYLAARIQAVAKPDQILISSDTRKLLGDTFLLTAIGSHALKGFSRRAELWRVNGLGPTGSRFEARSGPTLTPLVGRKHEISVLLDLWSDAKNGDGQVALVTGEPGIGKSRIAQYVRDLIRDEAHTHLRYQCSPFHTNSELFPVIQQVERAADITGEDSAESKLDKLTTLFQGGGLDITASLPVLASLLSVPSDGRFEAPDLTPERQKERTLEIFIEQIRALAAQTPLLLLVEDLHWVDPTFLELLDRLVRAIETMPALAVFTFRSEFASSWIGRANVSLLTLNRLAKRQCTSMVGGLANGKRLPPEVMDQIVAKSDGVPLFVEELTKVILESDLLVDEGDHLTLGGPFLKLDIPNSLHDSLLARLDRLGAAKEIAQVGAVIGREFGHQLLARVSRLSAEELEHALGELIDSELIFRRGSTPELTYVFKHALVQDAAYHSLLNTRRQKLHARIAQVLSEHFANLVDSRPEILAHHFVEANQLADSLAYWELAGQRAVSRFAHAEAIGHFTKALKLIHEIDEPEALAGRELKIQIAVAGSLAASEGWGSTAARRAYERASDLCDQTGEVRLLSSALSGEWAYQIHAHPRHVSVRDLAIEFLRIGRTRGDTLGVMMAHRNLAVSEWVLGENASARQNAEAALDMYEADRHGKAATIFGLDPRASALSYLARILWAQGYTDRAMGAAEDAIAWAKAVSNANTLGMCMLYRVYCERDMGAVEALQRDSQALMSFCEENGLKMWHAKSTMFNGWAKVQLGSGEEGLEQIRSALEANGKLGTLFLRPYHQSLLVEAAIALGRVDEALESVSEALALVEEMDDRCWEAELRRLKGKALLMAGGATTSEEAEDCFIESLAVAQAQGNRPFELRAASELARLWGARGERQRARDTLAPVRDWFTEGLDTPDLEQAGQLLEQLA